jgi:hypothetical protein
MDEDPFTCFTRRRIDVRKRSKPSILTIPSGTHLPVTTYQRYWTHIVVPPPLKHFFNVALTAPLSGRITTNLGRHKKWGKWKIIFVSTCRGLVEIRSEFGMRRYVNYWDLLGGYMLFLPSLKFYSSSKICTATCSWYYIFINITKNKKITTKTRVFWTNSGNQCSNQRKII